MVNQQPTHMVRVWVRIMVRVRVRFMVRVRLTFRVRVTYKDYSYD